MSVEEKQTCNMHTKEKENLGTCCRVIDEQDNAEQLTYEHHAKVGPAPKSVSQLLQEGMELQRRLENE